MKLKRYYEFINENKTNTVLLYHGSSKLISKLTRGNNISNPTYGGVNDSSLGIFLTDSTIMSDYFAGSLEYSCDDEKYISTGEKGYRYTVELKYSKPLIITNDDEEYEDSVQKYFELIENSGGGETLRDKLLSEGYDCIIMKECTTNYYADDIYEIYVALIDNNVNIIDKKELK